MKNFCIAIALLASITVNAQVQFGGVIRGQNNAAVIGNIGRTNDNIKVIDSALSVKIPLLTLVGTGLKVDGSSVTQPVSDVRSSTLSTTTGAAGAGSTLTISGVAGLFHYITSIEIRLYSAAARTGVAAPIVITTTNLPGFLSYTFDTAGAIGTSVVQNLITAVPLKSLAANTNTTIVCPIVTGGIWRTTVTYFTAL